MVVGGGGGGGGGRGQKFKKNFLMKMPKKCPKDVLNEISTSTRLVRGNAYDGKLEVIDVNANFDGEWLEKIGLMKIFLR